jgi:tRNA-splicing ligase RtcB
MSLKWQCEWNAEGRYYELKKGVKVPVRLFLSEKLFQESEEEIYRQVVNATEFPGVRDVVITPDVHTGYVVPVGCVMATSDTLCQAPVGFDIGCFTTDTLVPLVDGRSYPIGELARSGDEFCVYAITETHRITVARATAKQTRADAPLVRVTLDNGREILCTPDHQFLRRDGSYQEAKDLTPETSLMPFYSGTDRDGYVYIQQPYSGRNQRVHWMVARAGLLGKVPTFTGQKTIIHHKNVCPADNRPENLEFMGDRDHMRLHRSVYERNTHFHSADFETRRIAALAAKAQTEVGHAYYADRGTRNILAYMRDKPEHFKASVAGNGERGKKYLAAYNVSEKRRAKSKEIANRLYTCETCGEQVKSGIGLHNQRRMKHGYNHKVVSVEPLSETADVYCLTVPEYGNFALDAGVFVHNCGMLAFKSSVSKGKGMDMKLRQKFSEQVMDTVGMGTGRGSGHVFDARKFNEIVRHGASALGFHRENSERDFIPVSDRWDIPKTPLERGISQLGSLGSGNHFCELQYDQEDHLWVMIHTGSRGFGHGLATYFIQEGKEYLQKRGVDMRGGAEAVYFEPDNPLYEGYRNAVAAGANFAIANRLLIWEAVGRAFEKVFGEEPELIYEISHNLAQEEEVPSLGGKAWVHRKGATRAFPAGHPILKGTKWETTGHPILIPGSMGDTSYILYAEPGAEKSLYSVNHGCGRRLSRSAAKRQFTQKQVNEQMKRLNVLVNAGGNVPIDESPNCYKPAKDVIDAVVKAGLARVAYTLTPIASLKGVD